MSQAIWKHDSNVIVINGGWNAAILLDSKWLERFLFPNEKVDVSIPPKPVIIPTITTSQMVISLRGQQLCFAPTSSNDQLLTNIEDIVTNIVNYLPHTPIGAMGINFLFEMKNVTQLNVYSSETFLVGIDNIGKIREENHKYSLLSPDGNVVNIDLRYYPEKQYTCEINFHHVLDGIEEIKRIFADNHIVNYKSRAEEIMNNLSSILEQGTM